TGGGPTAIGFPAREIHKAEPSGWPLELDHRNVAAAGLAGTEAVPFLLPGSFEITSPRAPGDLQSVVSGIHEIIRPCASQGQIDDLMFSCMVQRGSGDCNCR